MVFLQGEKRADIKLANQILGRQWHEVFMERIVSAFRPLHYANAKLSMKVGTVLEKKVRDRFLMPKEDGYSVPKFHLLNPARKRVSRILVR